MPRFDNPQPEPKEEEKSQIDKVRTTVAANADRVAKLGEWPPYIEPGSLLERIPKEGGEKAAGFDAGIACATNLIPEDRQKLAACLHANYSKEAVLQIRQEAAAKNPDSETAWWLAACAVCKEGGIDQEAFLKQIEDFKILAANPEERGDAAQKEFAVMTSAFTLKEGVPYGEKDGCIQGAYIAGYPFGSEYSSNYGIYFIGTYEDSLGLEDFKWSDEKDEKGRAKSGPVFGSKQFVKCASEDEWRRAMEVVKAKLPIEEKK
jgi:hypothetical protein